MSIRIAIYQDGERIKSRDFESVEAVAQALAGLSPNVEARRVVEDARPDIADEQRLQRVETMEDGPDAETGLRIVRITWTAVGFDLEDVRTRRLVMLGSNYDQAQAALGCYDAATIDFRIAVLPVLNLVNRTSLTAAQRNQFTDEVAKATKLQTNRNHAVALRAAINSAQTIADIRAVELTQGWAQ